jgi:GTPase KRas
MGDGGVGKTASTIQFVANHFVEMYDPTIEDSYKRHIVVDETQFLVDILDTAGQDDFSPLRDSWIRESEAFLLIYSVTDRNSLEYLEGILQQIERTCEGRQHVPIILAGNKCDLDDRRQVSTQEGQQWARQHGLTTAVEFSAKTRINVQATFEAMVREAGQAKGAFGKTHDKKKRAQACSIL